MPAEQLNIKINLDINELNANVKKAKTKIGEVAATAERSIPKITTESNKAGRALKDISEAGGKVKKSLEDIGDKAKSSLSRITGESGKITTAFQKLGLAGRVANTGMNVDSTTTSLDEMKGTMESIARIDLFGALSAQSSKFTNVFKNLRKEIKDTAALQRFQNTVMKNSSKVADALRSSMEEFGFSQDQISQAIERGNARMERHQRIVRTKLTAAYKALRLEVSKLTSAFISISSAIFALILPINALGVSKMAREMDVAAERVGFSAQAYQEWTYVLNRAGIEASELVEVMKTLTEAQIDVVKGEKEYIAAFEKLGMTKEQVASMSQEQLWNATISALQNMEDATMRNIVAQRIFEEDMSKLTPLLNMTNQ